MEKGEINLSKKGDELIIKVGVFRRHVLLPKRMAVFEPQKAKIEGKVLIITFGGREDGKKKRS